MKNTCSDKTNTLFGEIKQHQELPQRRSPLPTTAQTQTSAHVAVQQYSSRLIWARRPPFNHDGLTVLCACFYHCAMSVYHVRIKTSDPDMTGDQSHNTSENDDDNITNTYTTENYHRSPFFPLQGCQRHTQVGGASLPVGACSLSHYDQSLDDELDDLSGDHWGWQNWNRPQDMDQADSLDGDASFKRAHLGNSRSPFVIAPSVPSPSSRPVVSDGMSRELELNTAKVGAFLSGSPNSYFGSPCPASAAASPSHGSTVNWHEVKMARGARMPALLPVIAYMITGRFIGHIVDNKSGIRSQLKHAPPHENSKACTTENASSCNSSAAMSPTHLEAPTGLTVMSDGNVAVAVGGSAGPGIRVICPWSGRLVRSVNLPPEMRLRGLTALPPVPQEQDHTAPLQPGWLLLVDGASDGLYVIDLNPPGGQGQLNASRTMNETARKFQRSNLNRFRFVCRIGGNTAAGMRSGSMSCMGAFSAAGGSKSSCVITNSLGFSASSASADHHPSTMSFSSPAGTCVLPDTSFAAQSNSSINGNDHHVEQVQTYFLCDLCLQVVPMPNKALHTLRCAGAAKLRQLNQQLQASHADAARYDDGRADADVDTNHRRPHQQHSQRPNERDERAAVVTYRTNTNTIISSNEVEFLYRTRIAVCDQQNHRVVMCNLAGHWLQIFGGERRGCGLFPLLQFNMPWGMVCTASGRLAVCDQDNHRVVILCTRTGRPVRAIGGLGKSNTVVDVPLLPEGGNSPHNSSACGDGHHDMGVDVKTAISQERWVEEEEASDSAVRKTVVVVPTASFCRPRSICLLRRQGHLCVCDVGNRRLVVMTEEGVVVRTVTSPLYSPLLNSGTSMFVHLRPLGIEALPYPYGGVVMVGEKDDNRLTMIKI